MKFAWVCCLFWGGLLIASDQEAEMNVNSRYTVESVEVSGTSETNISGPLRKDIGHLVGEKLNSSLLDDLAKRIRRELHVRSVTHLVTRGNTPEHVKVVFEVKGRPRSYEVSIPKFLYHSKQGWSAAAEGTIQLDRHRFTAGVVSDGDELSERYAGVTGRYENRKLGTDRVGFRFVAESFHEKWNRTTRMAAADAGDLRTSPIYRARGTSPRPSSSAAPLTLSVGASFGRMEPELSTTELSANAATATLRYHRRMEGTDTDQQEIDAAYNLRTATRVLDSDFVYTRHHFSAEYMYTHGRHTVLDHLMAGAIGGRAPLFERFVLGRVPRCAGGISSTSTRWAATAWRTTPSSIDTGFSKSSTIRVRAGATTGGPHALYGEAENLLHSMDRRSLSRYAKAAWNPS